MATVIRVKRKKSDRPAEALIVVSRGKKTGDKHGAKRELETITDTEEKVFRFATTVKTNSPMNDEVKEKVRNAILLQQKRQTAERPRHFSNEKKSLVFLKHKLKNMAVHHQLLSDKHPVVNPSTKPAFHRSSSPPHAIYPPIVPNRLVDQNQHHRSSKDAPRKLYYPHSITSEKQASDKIGRKMPTHSKKYPNQDFKRNLIKSVATGSTDSEYVYDLFYCSKTNDWNVKDVLYVKPCK